MNDPRTHAMERPAQIIAGAFGRGSTTGLQAMLVLAAVVLGWRRVAVSLEPLGPIELFAVGLGLAMATAAARLGANRPAAFILPTLALVILALAVSVPGSPAAGLVLLWLPLVGEEIWAWQPFRQLRRMPAAERTAPTSPDIGTSFIGPAAEDRSIDSAPAADVTQQWVRTRTGDSREAIAGWLRVRLSPGQRTAVAHVAFCPPLEQSPEIRIQQQAGPPVEIKPAQTLPFGARFEMKLADPSPAAAEVLLQFTAESRE